MKKIISLIVTEIFLMTTLGVDFAPASPAPHSLLRPQSAKDGGDLQTLRKEFEDNASAKDGGIRGVPPGRGHDWETFQRGRSDPQRRREERVRKERSKRQEKRDALEISNEGLAKAIIGAHLRKLLDQGLLPAEATQEKYWRRVLSESSHPELSEWAYLGVEAARPADIRPFDAGDGGKKRVGFLAHAVMIGMLLLPAPSSSQNAIVPTPTTQTAPYRASDERIVVYETDIQKASTEKEKVGIFVRQILPLWIALNDQGKSTPGFESGMAATAQTIHPKLGAFITELLRLKSDAFGNGEEIYALISSFNTDYLADTGFYLISDIQKDARSGKVQFFIGTEGIVREEKVSLHGKEIRILYVRRADSLNIDIGIAGQSTRGEPFVVIRLDRSEGEAHTLMGLYANPPVGLSGILMRSPSFIRTLQEGLVRVFAEADGEVALSDSLLPVVTRHELRHKDDQLARRYQEIQDDFEQSVVNELSAYLGEIADAKTNPRLALLDIAAIFWSQRARAANDDYFARREALNRLALEAYDKGLVPKIRRIEGDLFVPDATAALDIFSDLVSLDRAQLKGIARNVLARGIEDATDPRVQSILSDFNRALANQDLTGIRGAVDALGGIGNESAVRALFNMLQLNEIGLLQHTLQTLKTVYAGNPDLPRGITILRLEERQKVWRSHLEADPSANAPIRKVIRASQDLVNTLKPVPQVQGAKDGGNRETRKERRARERREEKGRLRQGPLWSRRQAVIGIAAATAGIAGGAWWLFTRRPSSMKQRPDIQPTDLSEAKEEILNAFNRFVEELTRETPEHTESLRNLVAFFQRTELKRSMSLPKDALMAVMGGVDSQGTPALNVVIYPVFWLTLIHQLDDDPRLKLIAKAILLKETGSFEGILLRTRPINYKRVAQLMRDYKQKTLMNDPSVIDTARHIFGGLMQSEYTGEARLYSYLLRHGLTPERLEKMAAFPAANDTAWRLRYFAGTLRSIMKDGRVDEKRTKLSFAIMFYYNLLASEGTNGVGTSNEEAIIRQVWEAEVSEGNITPDQLRQLVMERRIDMEAVERPDRFFAFLTDPDYDWTPREESAPSAKDGGIRTAPRLIEIERGLIPSYNL